MEDEILDQMGAFVSSTVIPTSGSVDSVLQGSSSFWPTALPTLAVQCEANEFFPMQSPVQDSALSPSSLPVRVFNHVASW